MAPAQRAYTHTHSLRRPYHAILVICLTMRRLMPICRVATPPPVQGASSQSQPRRRPRGKRIHRNIPYEKLLQSTYDQLNDLYGNIFVSIPYLDRISMTLGNIRPTNGRQPAGCRFARVVNRVRFVYHGFVNRDMTVGLARARAALFQLAPQSLKMRRGRKCLPPGYK